MKTTVEIQDSLLEEVRRLADSRTTTLRSLIEQGLRWVVQQDATTKRYQLPDCSFTGDGFRPNFVNGDWAALRAAIYGDRS